MTSAAGRPHYSFDTSALIDGIERFYPIANFPNINKRDVMSAPMPTSFHLILASGRILKIAAKRIVENTNAKRLSMIGMNVFAAPEKI